MGLAVSSRCSSFIQFIRKGVFFLSTTHSLTHSLTTGKKNRRVGGGGGGGVSLAEGWVVKSPETCVIVINGQTAMAVCISVITSQKTGKEKRL